MYSKLSEKQNIRKVAKSPYIFLTTPDEVEKYVQSNTSDNSVHHYNVEILNFFDPESQLSRTKSMIKNKTTKLLSELKKFKVQIILFLVYKKRNVCKIFHSCTKLIPSNSNIDEPFQSMHQNIMSKI